MTSGNTRYLLIEAAISAAINAVFSIVFALIFFGAATAVPTRAIIFDALPQSFMIALMATAIPTMLTRRRLRSGVVQPLPPGRLRLPRHLPMRALLVAAVVATVMVALHALLLPLVAPPFVAKATVLIGKTVYGAMLGAFVTTLTLRVSLGEP